MKKWIGNALLLIFVLTSTSSLAAEGGRSHQSGLNSVVYQIHLKGFASTHTANTRIVVNATASNNSLGQVQQQIMQKLQQIAPQDVWHIVDFNRSQDSAGLETLRLRVSARLTQAQLNGLRDQVKAISKKGLKFEVQGIDFQPSAVEYEKERAVLRQQVYQLVSEELSRLNKQYPSQHFFVHKIDFFGLFNTPMAQRAMHSGVSLNAHAAKGVFQTQSPTVGQSVYMTATVVLSSEPQ